MGFKIHFMIEMLGDVAYMVYLRSRPQKSYTSKLTPAGSLLETLLDDRPSARDGHLETGLQTARKSEHQRQLDLVAVWSEAKPLYKGSLADLLGGLAHAQRGHLELAAEFGTHYILKL